MDANRTLIPTEPRHSLGEPRVLISRSALLHNAKVLRQRVAPGIKLCAMVKADGYGHGARIVADALGNLSADDNPPPADALAVASLDEAAALASSAEMQGTPLPMIVFRPLENAFVGRQRLKIEEAVRLGWVLTVCTPAAADDVARIALACGRRAAVQVMIDTGLVRSGVAPERVAALVERIEQRPSLRLTGLCTHFASAEVPGDPFNAEQLTRFLSSTDRHVGDNARVLRHTAGSGAIFFNPESHLDMIRPGISLYGIDPTGRPDLDRPLRPVMKWTAPLIGITDIDPDTTVGYGRTWKAQRRTRVGLVPVGYADGYPRCFSNKAVVMLHGHAVPVIGRVSMDLTTIDVTDVAHPAIGDEVILLDSDPLSPASVYALARWADTMPYEIFCGIGQRVARVAMGEVDESAGPASAN